MSARPINLHPACGQGPPAPEGRGTLNFQTSTRERKAGQRERRRASRPLGDQVVLAMLTGRWPNSGTPGSRRLPRRSVILVSARLCFEPETGLRTTRFPSSTTPLRNTGGGYQKNGHGPLHTAKILKRPSWIRSGQSRVAAGGGPRSGCWGLAMTCSSVGWWEPWERRQLAGSVCANTMPKPRLRNTISITVQDHIRHPRRSCIGRNLTSHSGDPFAMTKRVALADSVGHAAGKLLAVNISLDPRVKPEDDNVSRGGC